MLNIYRMLFLALKKVRMVKITPCQIPAKFSILPNWEGADILIIFICIAHIEDISVAIS